MFVALGFLGATFLALLSVPAIARRADRLAKRRAEAAFPLSLEQVAAERDHLRADLAMRERVLERKAEKGQLLRSESLQEIGRRDMEIATLRDTLSAREERIAGLERDLATMTTDRDMTRDRLANETETLRLTRAERETLRAEVERLTQVLTTTQTLLSSTEQDLASERATLAGTAQDLAELRAAHATLRDAHETTVGALNVQRLQAAELQTALATSETTTSEWRARHGLIEEELITSRAETADWQGRHREALDQIAQRNAKLADLEKAFMARGQELGDERKAQSVIAAERDQLRRELREAREALRAQEKAATAATREASRHEAERQHQFDKLAASLKTAEERLDALRADRERDTARLTEMRAERTRLKQDLTVLRREAEAMDAAIRAENETLRAEMNRIADMILADHKAKVGQGAGQEAGQERR